MDACRASGNSHCCPEEPNPQPAVVANLNSQRCRHGFCPCWRVFLFVCCEFVSLYFIFFFIFGKWRQEVSWDLIRFCSCLQCGKHLGEEKKWSQGRKEDIFFQCQFTQNKERKKINSLQQSAREDQSRATSFQHSDCSFLKCISSWTISPLFPLAQKTASTTWTSFSLHKPPRRTVRIFRCLQEHNSCSDRVWKSAGVKQRCSLFISLMSSCDSSSLASWHSARWQWRLDAPPRSWCVAPFC